MACAHPPWIMCRRCQSPPRGGTSLHGLAATCWLFCDSLVVTCGCVMKVHESTFTSTFIGDPEQTIHRLTHASMLFTLRGKECTTQIAKKVLADLSWAEDWAAWAVRLSSGEVALQERAGARLARCCSELLMQFAQLGWPWLHLHYLTYPTRSGAEANMMSESHLPQLQGGLLSKICQAISVIIVDQQI